MTDVDFIKDVMNSKTAPFPKHLATGGLVLPMLGNDQTVTSMSVGALPSPYVKAVRKIYATAFQSQNLKIALPKVNSVVEKVISIIEARKKDGPVDVQSLFVKMTLDAIGVVAFETNLGGLDGSRSIYDLLLQAGYIARQRFVNPVKRAYFGLFPNSAEARRQQSIIDNLSKEWKKLTKEILKRDDPVGGEPIWHLLRTLKYPETQEPFEFKDLMFEMAGVVLAGMDTTGHQLGWLFALLASHPRVVNKLLEELREHGMYGSDSKELTFEGLNELTYLTAVIKEGMRIGHISAATFMRTVPKDMTILGYRIPKGTLIITPGTRAVMSEEMWGDPHVFRPERWLTGEDMSQKFSLGFSTGPRDCIGQKLAMLEMRFTIVKLLTRYNFTLHGDLNELFEDTKDGLVIEATNGIWLQFEDR